MGRLVKGAGGPAAPVEAGDPDAQRRGYQAGLDAGREAGLATVTELLVAARADAEQVRAQARDAALVLARRMAEKIVGHAVDVAPAVMGDLVAQALVASRARAGAVIVRVHPQDLAAVEASRARWGTAAVVVRLAADVGVGRYGCVVETPVGRVDARLEAQLEALERALRARGEP
jgi:flagellar biosynthesis/type III secretory pathway protein FliH